MKKTLFFFCPVLVGSFFLLQTKDNEPSFNLDALRAEAIACAPGGQDVYIRADKKFIGLLPGWGDHSYTITTSNDSAQVYFNQGLSMYYSYHAREALASFREAARLDSNSAMAYWGQALAMGPSYNYGYSYKMGQHVPAALSKMNRAAAFASEKEKDLIAAMNQRYDVIDTTDKNRSTLNAAYAEALRPLVKKYPDDIDIKALYTDAVMLIHAWDFWNNDGTPKAWTPELVKNCEEILAKDGQHPGGLHYYIHVTEASRAPEVALPAADSLIKLYPGIAHMVHMSSHEYERIGYYAKGVDANEKADQSLALYDSLAKGLYPVIHSPHYYAVDAYCALSGAMQKKGIEKSLALRNLVKPTPEVHYTQYQFMYPQLAMVRMGMWQKILDDPTVVPSEWTFATILDQFAKGMAAAKTGDHKKAEQHLARLRETKKDKALKTKFVPHTSSPAECADVAEYILLANTLFHQNKQSAAIDAIKKAIAVEDELIYVEPKIWILPARQYLGAFLMQMKRFKDAEQVYRDDLSWNPGNGWSLVGLYNALKAQNKNGELAKLKKSYMYSFSDAEVVPDVSAY